MTIAIDDPDVRLPASLSASISGDYAQASNSWRGSPFEWILGCPSRQKGAIFESLVAGWCAAKGLNVTRTGDSDADRIVERLRVEIKGSTLWKAGRYKFQQLRDQNYDCAVCLGISPFDAHCWTIPKDEIMCRWRNGEISSQHGGSAGTDTAWLDVRPGSAPIWIEPWGGRLSEAFEVLKRLADRGGRS